MMKRFLAFAILLILSGFSVFAAAPADNEVKLRALLVGVERFATHPRIEPAARNNLIQLTQALGQDSRGYQSIRISLNEAHSFDSFKRLIEDSFYEADENDISLFYITTHGLYSPEQSPMDYAMVLSDGTHEYELTAQALYLAINPIPGLKVLIIDTCNAGAVIDRGIPGSGLGSLFHGEDYKVLTSSGGSEPSFFWSTGEGSFFGGSYFADALLLGISPQGNYAADANRDGIITFLELHTYLLQNYGVARPYIYPMEDQTAFLHYDTKQSAANPALITNLSLSQSAFSSIDPTLEFSYTLNRPASVNYQLIYQVDHHWQFWDAQIIPESETNMGRKDRLLQVATEDPSISGYALLYLITVSDGIATPHAQAILMVEPQEGDPKLAAIPMLLSFHPDRGEELPILIQHDFPIRLTVKVKNEQGTTIKLLVSDQATRPSYLSQGGSLVYWNGLTAKGIRAPEGLYTVEVSSDIGGQHFQVSSGPFTVK